MRLCAIAVPLLAALGIAGCGQKGPLFLPQEKLDELERKRDERDSGKTPAKTGSAPPTSMLRPTA